MTRETLVPLCEAIFTRIIILKSGPIISKGKDVKFLDRKAYSGRYPALMQVQQEYAHKYPGVQVLPGGIYLSPAFHFGHDVFCAYHPNGQMLGYSVVYAQLPTNSPQNKHTIWTEVKIIPSINHLIEFKSEPSRADIAQVTRAPIGS